MFAKDAGTKKNISQTPIVSAEQGKNFYRGRVKTTKCDLGTVTTWAWWEWWRVLRKLQQEMVVSCSPGSGWSLWAVGLCLEPDGAHMHAGLCSAILCSTTQSRYCYSLTVSHLYRLILVLHLEAYYCIWYCSYCILIWSNNRRKLWYVWGFEIRGGGGGGEVFHPKKRTLSGKKNTFLLFFPKRIGLNDPNIQCPPKTKNPH